MTKLNQLKLDIKKDNKTDKLKYYCAFSFLFINPILKSKLFEYFNYDIKRAWNCDKNDLSMVCNQYSLTYSKDFFVKKDKIDPDEAYKKAFLDKEVKILTFEDDNYPELLKQIPDFPLSLYYKGDINILNNNYNLAVVGSRKASTEAKLALDSIISRLNNANINIVSGLAFGIDTQAHLSAINADLKTIAVVGSGLDIVYPSQNKKLFNDIVKNNGLVFSEYPLKTPPLPQNFPQRNRIVVGLSSGTLVAEAQLKSGAMISANLTLDYNRELMCIPGYILNPNTRGIYQLIKNGAGIVTNYSDLLNYMDWAIILKEDKTTTDLNETHKKILNVLSYQPKNFDELLFETKEEISKLMVGLTELELKSLIIQANNKYYKK